MIIVHDNHGGGGGGGAEYGAGTAAGWVSGHTATGWSTGGGGDSYSAGTHIGGGENAYAGGQDSYTSGTDVRSAPPSRRDEAFLTFDPADSVRRHAGRAVYATRRYISPCLKSYVNEII